MQQDTHFNNFNNINMYYTQKSTTEVIKQHTADNLTNVC